MLVILAFIIVFIGMFIGFTNDWESLEPLYLFGISCGLIIADILVSTGVVQ